MRTIVHLFCLLLILSSFSSCVSKKTLAGVQSELDSAKAELDNYGKKINEYKGALAACEAEKNKFSTDLSGSQNTLRLKEEQIADLRDQIADFRKQRDKQLQQVEGLTELSQSTSDNIKETLSQLEKKDKYIQLLQKAKTRADSINLALGSKPKRST